MPDFSPEEIKELASSLEIGLRCFWHNKTGEFFFIPDFDDGYFDKTEWKGELDKLRQGKGHFIEIERPTSRESFRMMVDFTNTLDDRLRLTERLFDALDNKKPFANFKNIIDNSGEYRNQWFAFKTQWYLQYVTNALESIDSSSPWAGELFEYDFEEEEEEEEE